MKSTTIIIVSIMIMTSSAFARPSDEVVQAGLIDDLRNIDMEDIKRRWNEIDFDAIGASLGDVKEFFVGVWDWGDNVVNEKLPALRTKVDQMIGYMSDVYDKSEKVYNRVSDKLEPLKPYYDDFMEFRSELIDAGIDYADELTDEWSEKLEKFNEAGGFEALRQVEEDARLMADRRVVVSNSALARRGIPLAVLVTIFVSMM